MTRDEGPDGMGGEDGARVATMEALHRALQDVIAACTVLETPHDISVMGRLTVLGTVVAETLVEARATRPDPSDEAWMEAWWNMVRGLTDMKVWLDRGRASEAGER